MESSIGKLIGSGGTADVYEWANNEVIKVFKPHMPIEAIEYEEHIGRLLNETLLSIPKYIRTIELNGKPAIVYEHVYGRSLAEILFEATDKSSIAASFAKLHYEIHQCNIGNLPNQKDRFNWFISRMQSHIGQNSKRIQELMSNLPIENKLCHGDFHPLNILVDGNKYTVIDWNDSCLGNPMLDVTWSYLILNSPSIEVTYGQDMANNFKEFSSEYLTYYSKYAKVDEDEILKYLPLAAIRRLYDNLSCERENLKYENIWLGNIIASNLYDMKRIL